MRRKETGRGPEEEAAASADSALRTMVLVSCLIFAACADERASSCALVRVRIFEVAEGGILALSKAAKNARSFLRAAHDAH